jgi:hypothetical protein
VGEDLGVGAAGFLEGVGENTEPLRIEGAVREPPGVYKLNDPTRPPTLSDSIFGEPMVAYPLKGCKRCTVPLCNSRPTSFPSFRRNGVDEK